MPSEISETNITACRGLFLKRAIAISAVLLIALIRAGSAAAEGCERTLTRDVIEESLKLGRSFLLHNQRSAGNFYYEYSWRTGKDSPGDNSVRQAGALWGLALLHHYKRTPELEAAIRKGFHFFEGISRQTKSGSRYVVYPGEPTGSLGGVALLALAMIDYLRASPPDSQDAELKKRLGEYLLFLQEARGPAGELKSRYDFVSGRAFGPASPYADGETLLAFTKAARHLGRAELKPLILELAARQLQINVRDALALHPDSNTTKGYYQWGSMAFFEIWDAGWDEKNTYRDAVIELAHWMIDVHRTLERGKNTAYAYEGIIHAYEIAKRIGRKDLEEKFGCVINTGLAKLTSWQLGSRLQNQFIKENRVRNDLRAVGGVQNQAAEDLLRIDVTQHQMHAAILALRYYYFPHLKCDPRGECSKGSAAHNRSVS